MFCLEKNLVYGNTKRADLAHCEVLNVCVRFKAQRSSYFLDGWPFLALLIAVSDFVYLL